MIYILYIYFFLISFLYNIWSNIFDIYFMYVCVCLCKRESPVERVFHRVVSRTQKGWASICRSDSLENKLLVSAGSVSVFVLLIPPLKWPETPCRDWDERVDRPIIPRRATFNLLKPVRSDDQPKDANPLSIVIGRCYACRKRNLCELDKTALSPKKM